MRTRVVVCAALLLLAAGRADAQFRVQPALPPPEDIHVELGAMFWKPTPELTIDSDQVSSATGGPVDLVQDFGIEKMRFTELRAVLKPGLKHKIRISHIPAEYQASTTLDRTITYKGVTFPVNIPASADLKWELWRLGYEYDFVTSQNGLVGFITELKYNHVTGNIMSSVGTASVDQTAPVPTIGLIMRGYVHRYVSITGEFTGFKIPHVKTFDGSFYDFDVYATGSITKYLGVQGGYHSVTAKYVVDTDTGNLKLKGPYIGALIRF
jgi:hypothetical protein